MSTAQFSTTTSGTNPEDASCRATWEWCVDTPSGGVTCTRLEQHFPDLLAAFEMDKLVNAQYEAGMLAGRIALARDIAHALAAERMG